MGRVQRSALLQGLCRLERARVCDQEALVKALGDLETAETCGAELAGSRAGGRLSERFGSGAGGHLQVRIRALQERWCQLWRSAVDSTRQRAREHLAAHFWCQPSLVQEVEAALFTEHASMTWARELALEADSSVYVKQCDSLVGFLQAQPVLDCQLRSGVLSIEALFARWVAVVPMLSPAVVSDDEANDIENDEEDDVGWMPSSPCDLRPRSDEGSQGEHMHRNRVKQLWQDREYQGHQVQDPVQLRQCLRQPHQQQQQPLQHPDQPQEVHEQHQQKHRHHHKQQQQQQSQPQPQPQPPPQPQQQEQHQQLFAEGGTARRAAQAQALAATEAAVSKKARVDEAGNAAGAEPLRTREAVTEIARILEIPETSPDWAFRVLQLADVGTDMEGAAARAFRVVMRRLHPDSRPSLGDDEVRCHEAIAKLQRARTAAQQGAAARRGKRVSPPRAPSNLRCAQVVGAVGYRRWTLKWTPAVMDAERPVTRWEIRVKDGSRYVTVGAVDPHFDPHLGQYVSVQELRSFELCEVDQRPSLLASGKPLEVCVVAVNSCGVCFSPTLSIDLGAAPWRKRSLF